MTFTFEEVAATRWGRLKMWVHYRMLHPWILPCLPARVRSGVYKASRRWVFGPNANNEDLIVLIQQCTAKVERA